MVRKEENNSLDKITEVVEKSAMILAGSVLLASGAINYAVERLNVYLEWKTYERRHKKHMRNNDNNYWF